VSRVRAAVSNSFGFGGLGTVLVFTEPAEVAPALRRPRAGDVEEVGPVVTGVGLAAALAHDDGRVVLLGREGSAALPGTAPGMGTGTGAATGTGTGTGTATGAATGTGAGLAGETLGEIRRFREGARVDPDDQLDAERARRLDRAAKLATLVVERALEDAAASAPDAGVVLGNAFGSVDSCAGFMHRVSTKGARAASPAEFPNLVPSSPVGHVSIYAGMHGPALMTADLMTSGESAFAQAVQLVRMGEASRVVACASEPRSAIVERVLAPLFDDAPARIAPSEAAPRFPDVAGRRDDLAAALAIESDAEARGRGARPLARVDQVLEWRGDGVAAAAEIRAPRGGRPEVICGRVTRATEDLVSKTHWRSAPRWSCSDALGESEALGAAALCAAAARVHAGHASDVLVVGLARGRGYAIVLAVP
jgi:3-oxoacyl-[acyl-carrier-protein] synthase II